MDKFMSTFATADKIRVKDSTQPFPGREGIVISTKGEFVDVYIGFRRFCYRADELERVEEKP